MNLMNKLIVIWSLVLFCGMARGQDDSHCIRNSNSISMRADIASLGLSYDHRFTKGLRLGAGVEFGFGYNLTLIDGGTYGTSEILGWNIYNRIELSDKIRLDIGVKRSYIILYDFSLDHGFSHTAFLGGSLSPSWELRNWNIGTSLWIGHLDQGSDQGINSISLTPIWVSYSVKF